MTGDERLRTLVAVHGRGRVVWVGADGAADDLEGAGTVVCPDWHRDGREPDHRRLLGRLRRAMDDTGLLIVEQPASAAYRPLSGMAGEVRVYHPTELIALVRAAGFAVEHAEVSESAGAAVPAVRVVARRLPVPPAALAVSAWGEPADGVQLDLRYADDEAEWIDPPPAKVWAGAAATGAFDAETAEHYPVDDPFGGRRGAEAVSRHFGCAVPADRLFFGAGVSGLLRDLAGLAEGGLVLAPPLTHPDLPAWAMRLGATVRTLTDERAGRGDLVVLDQPAFDGRAWPVERIAELSRQVPAVVVDESAAAYLGAARSAVRLTAQPGNLVVVRGFTKAYSWGGLRVGYAVAAPAIADRARELMTPMQTGAPALAAALAALAAGDVLRPLRERIRAVKPPFAGRLVGAGLDVEPGNPDIPWVSVRDPDGSAERRLLSRGIRPLAPAPIPGVRPDRVLRLTVPLSDRRIGLFERLFGQDAS
jgi:histidinol-phosphate/aromatic aminotransferase/cobyric acid decarboxylase-like protein